MSDKFKFIEINYYFHQEFTTPGEVINKHAPSNLFAGFLAANADITLVKHLNYSGSHKVDGTKYQFFKRKNRFMQIPFATHRFVRDEKPDMVLVQGLIFPSQVIALRRKLGRHCKIVLQHHGELPFKRKRIFQKLADRNVNGYIFSAEGNAKEWLESGVIRDKNKCYEINPSSSLFSRQDKMLSRERMGMSGDTVFLWVGRLNANKDPLTVLKGFEKYFQQHPGDRLYMIYAEEEGSTEVRDFIQSNIYLSEAVVLVGKIANPELEYWYSAADYFVSGSHRESGRFAVTEAMACGCIPILTDIPSSMIAIDNGKAGFFYEVGNSRALSSVLLGLNPALKQEISMKVEKQFKETMSPQAIARKLFELYTDLKTK